MNQRNMIFVFGSNEGGHHGRGAAKYAYDHKRAEMGIGYGHTGNSFAIPTKDRSIRNTLSLTAIQAYVKGFLWYAHGRPDLSFQVTCIGCGLAGLKHKDIAPMFEIHPENCFFDTLWQPYLPEYTQFWGTF